MQKKTDIPSRWFNSWPFHPLVGGHLTFPKGHLTIPKRPQRIARLAASLQSFWTSQVKTCRKLLCRWIWMIFFSPGNSLGCYPPEQTNMSVEYHQIFNWRYIFKWFWFHCHVSFRGANLQRWAFSKPHLAPWAFLRHLSTSHLGIPNTSKMLIKIIGFLLVTSHVPSTGGFKTSLERGGGGDVLSLKIHGVFWGHFCIAGVFLFRFFCPKNTNTLKTIGFPSVYCGCFLFCFCAFFLSGFFLEPEEKIQIQIHPRNLTWIPKMAIFKRNHLFQVCDILGRSSKCKSHFNTYWMFPDWIGCEMCVFEKKKHGISWKQN